MSDGRGQQTVLGNFVSILMILLMTMHLYAPFASAANMASCEVPLSSPGSCDEYDSSDDMTPFQQDWIEGTYDFTLNSTSTIRLELVWALREFNLEALGLGAISAALAIDGLDENDGAPADLIRDQFDIEIAPSVTVKDKLIIEINKEIKNSVESGFGDATTSTGYFDTYTNAGTTIACSTDPSTDSFDEGAAENNVFEPPICLRSVVYISVSQDSFNLVSNGDLDLERAYQGLLTMGTEVTTMFSLSGLPGHKSSYSFNPPPYATIKSVDANGTRAARPGPPAYFAGEWEIDNRNAAIGGGSVALPIEVEMMHRNRSDTTTVVIPANEKALDLQIKLDLRDESAATLDFVVALHYLDEATMTDWGISMMSVAERATMKQVTADGIRLAYHNGIVDLSNITSQFPVDTIAEGVSSTVAGMETIQMNEMTWVSESVSAGIEGPVGGLNFTHRGTPGCTEELIVPPSEPLHYCLKGSNAMSYENPVYLRTTSQPFSMRLLDILKENNEQETVEEFLNVLTNEDFRRVMNSGIEIETALDSSYLSAIVPSNLPPNELTLEIILPTWIQTKDGLDRITLQDSLYGDDQMNISFAGTAPYDWRNVIKNSDNEVACFSNQSTCVASSMKIDAMSFNFNEWDRSVSFEFGIDAGVSMHRIGIPQDRIPTYGEHSISMAAIPSDLVRLGIDLSSRLDDPYSRTIELDFLCSINSDEAFNLTICNESITFAFTSVGLVNFVARMGEVLTDYVQQSIQYLTTQQNSRFKTVDLSAFAVNFELANVGAPDLIVSDNEGISLSMNIPRVKFKLAVDGDLGEMFSGNFDSTELSLTTNALRQTLLWPMTSMMQSFSDVLVNGVISLSGITSPTDDASVDPYSIPISTTSFLNEEFQIAFNGPMTIHMPKGIRLLELNSEAGNIEERKVDGRQEITYNMPFGNVEDTITFRVQVTWYFFFLFLWKYMAIFAILLLLGVRRFRRKRARKKARRNYSKARSAEKVSINQNEFADLSGFHSKGIHGDMEDLKDYSGGASPAMPAGQAGFGISAVRQKEIDNDMFN
tara:strand:- start:840 stop:3983 length:3144 start_codon:yes stop_codon:yes gene_type:complete